MLPGGARYDALNEPLLRHFSKGTCAFTATLSSHDEFYFTRERNNQDYQGSEILLKKGERRQDDRENSFCWWADGVHSVLRLSRQ